MYDKFESIAYTNSQAVVVSSACTSGSKKRPLPFRGFGGPTVTTPTAEGGGEEVNRPQTPNRRSADDLNGTITKTCHLEHLRTMGPVNV